VSPTPNMLDLALLFSAAAFHTGAPVSGRMSAFPTVTHKAAAALPAPLDSGCVLSALNATCPSEYPQRFENGDGFFALPHSAFVGKNALGTLEVKPNMAACCVAAGGLYINPPPGAGIPAQCSGTGSVVFPAVAKFTLLYWMDYTNDCAPPASPNATCAALGGPLCEQKSCFQCDGSHDCYCVPWGICHSPGNPAGAC